MPKGTTSEANKDNPLYRHHSSDCEALAITNVTGQSPTPKTKKKTISPMSVEKGLSARKELRYDKSFTLVERIK